MNKKVILEKVSKGLSTALNVYCFIDNLFTVADIYTVNPYRHPDYMAENLEMIDTMTYNEEEDEEEEVTEKEAVNEEVTSEDDEEADEETDGEVPVEEEVNEDEKNRKQRGGKYIATVKHKKINNKLNKFIIKSSKNKEEGGGSEDALSNDEVLKKANS